MAKLSITLKKQNTAGLKIHGDNLFFAKIADMPIYHNDFTAQKPLIGDIAGFWKSDKHTVVANFIISIDQIIPLSASHRCNVPCRSAS
jgi:hypothetical protein